MNDLLEMVIHWRFFFFFFKFPHTKYLKEIYTGKQDAYGAFNINNEGLQTKDALFIPIFEPPFF